MPMNNPPQNLTTFDLKYQKKHYLHSKILFKTKLYKSINIHTKRMQVYTIQVYQINSNTISVVIFESSEKFTTIPVTISFEYGNRYAYAFLFSGGLLLIT